MEALPVPGSSWSSCRDLMWDLMFALVLGDWVLGASASENKNKNSCTGTRGYSVHYSVHTYCGIGMLHTSHIHAFARSYPGTHCWSLTMGLYILIHNNILNKYSLSLYTKTLPHHLTHWPTDVLSWNLSTSETTCRNHRSICSNHRRCWKTFFSSSMLAWPTHSWPPKPICTTQTFSRWRRSQQKCLSEKRCSKTFSALHSLKK